MPKELEEISRRLLRSDLFVSIGTSGVVYPAAGFVSEAKRSGAFCLEINKEISEITNLFDLSISGLATHEVPKFVEEILDQS